MEQEPISGNGYGKRPVWQWVIVYAVLAAIVYGLVYYFVFSNGSGSMRLTTGGYAPAPSQEYPPTAQQTPQPVSPPTSQPSNLNQPTENVQNIVTYTDSGFSPSTLTIKKGDTVTFKNTASGGMWVASKPHPMHTDYPAFDAKRKIAPGETYEFTFTNTGSWGYHNHMNPSERGTIVVQ